LDVCDAASVQALGTALDHGGVSIDILYNNAGVALGRSSAIASGPSFAYDDWELCLKTNVLGPTRVLEAVLPSLARGGGGGGGGGGGEEDGGGEGGGGGDRPFTVVNISSSLGRISRVNLGSAFSTSSMDMVYRSSKAALNMATVCAAAELRTLHPVGTGL
jgi:NAD(P)-dependent dehydrogenase (short-subunit alcohol dehydrogenase family)